MLIKASEPLEAVIARHWRTQVASFTIFGCSLKSWWFLVEGTDFLREPFRPA